jgi:hypothetical protein
MQQTVQIDSKCQTCPMRARAAENPKSLMSRFWRWHTGWCPGWKAYKKELESKGLPPPKV